MSSLLTQVTVVPAEMVSVCGPKTKLSIFTSVLELCACAGRGLPALVTRVAPKIESTATATAKTETLILIRIFLSSIREFMGLGPNLEFLSQRRINHGQ